MVIFYGLPMVKSLNNQLFISFTIAYAAGQQVLAVAANETANEAADTAAAGANYC